ncbi:hypothetical protein G6F61_015009 [Rhizopus arrhizus]|nr:hypothetical protein G6F61_015009 [Rhizopus arrhizus]
MHAAERVRQPVLVADPKPHHGQPRLHAAAPAVAPRHLRRLRAGGRRARPGRGPVRGGGGAVLRVARPSQPAVAAGVCRAVLRHHGRAGRGGGPVV